MLFRILFSPTTVTPCFLTPRTPKPGSQLKSPKVKFHQPKLHNRIFTDHCHTPKAPSVTRLVGKDETALKTLFQVFVINHIVSSIQGLIFEPKFDFQSQMIVF